MRAMVNDVRDECVRHHVNVHCEVYNGQFLNLVRYSEDGTPLTRLASFQQYFREVNPSCTRATFLYEPIYLQETAVLYFQISRPTS